MKNKENNFKLKTADEILREHKLGEAREEMLRETEEALSKNLTSEDLEAHKKAVEKRRMQKPDPQI